MEFGFKVISDGTDNHLFLIDLQAKDMTGKQAEEALGKANITVNKNAVPNDPQSPFITSGLRIGTPAATTRGFKEKEMRDLALWICEILDNIDNADVISRVQQNVKDLCKLFPVYER